MIKVELLTPRDLTATDIKWLGRGCEGSIDEVSPADHIDSATNGHSGIYRVSGDAEGIFVLLHNSNSMVVTAVAGRNFMRRFEEVHGAIKAAAAACGAKYVSGFVTRRGLASLYKQKTKARFAEYFVEELQ